VSELATTLYERHPQPLQQMTASVAERQQQQCYDLPLSPHPTAHPQSAGEQAGLTATLLTGYAEDVTRRQPQESRLVFQSTIPITNERDKVATHHKSVYIGSRPNS